MKAIWLTTFVLAWRNVWRQPRRTAIVSAALALGLGGLLLAMGYLGGLRRYLVATATASLIGDAQIHATGYLATRDPEQVLPDPDALLARADATPDVAGASPRAFGSGLLLPSPDETADVVVMGVDPQRERRVTRWDEGFLTGTYPRQEGEILVGKDLFERLGLARGQVLDLTVFNFTTASMETMKVRVCGVLSTGNPGIDWNTVVARLPDLQARLGHPSAVHEVAIRFASEGAARRESALAGLAGPGLEVLPWQRISPTLAKLVQMQSRYFAIAVGIILVVTAFGIVNVLRVSFAERRREHGTLLATGTPPGRLALLMVMEAGTLGVVGAGLGLLVAGALYLPLSRWGVPIGEMTAAGLRVPSRIHLTLRGRSTVGMCALYVLLPSLVASANALSVLRLDPVEALRAA